ncbi:MAG: molecular chaperone TorD family protein [Bdellovibrionales bacterium]|nr:molecular chaperone TorD family protein [Massilia sp.]
MADGAHRFSESALEHHGALSAEEAGRADLYALCARLLIDSADAALLGALGGAAPAGAGSIASSIACPPCTPLDEAFGKLACAASITPADAVREQFDALFTSTGSPAINPYASVYLSGFMHDKPLAGLRGDLAQLGLGRVAGRGEAEDHLGVLCEIMRVMIENTELRQPLWRQQQFFARHIAPWHAQCLAQVRVAAGATFYGCAAEFVQTFLDIEALAFSIDVAVIHREFQ